MRPLSQLLSGIVPVKAVTRLANANLSRGRFDLADGLLRFGLLGRPRHFRLLELYALSAHNSGRHAQALSRWQRVRQLHPDVAMALCGVAANARELGRLSEAISAIESALARFPNDFVVLSEAARVYEHARDYDTAADCWARALAFPMLPEVCFQVAATNFLRAGRFEEAADALTRVAAGPTVRDRARQWFETAAMGMFPGQPGFERFFADALRRFGQEIHALPQVAEWTSDPDASRKLLVEIVARLPRDAEARESYVRTLIRCDLLSDADAELDRFEWPAEQTRVILRSLVKMRTGDARAAASDLSRYAASRPRDEAAQLLIERARTIVDLTSEAIDLPAAAPAEASAAKGEVRDLMLRFESLGSDCSFGLVQRYYGAEPLGLLRWTQTNLEMLTRAFEARFDGIGLPENTELFVGGGGEVYVRDKKWDLAMHTFILESEVSMTALFPKMCRRFVFLSRKLLSDVEDGRKVLVFTSAAAEEEALARLQDVVGTLGPSPILSIQQTASGSSIGEGGTTEIRPGLFVGHLPKVTFLQGDEEPREWLRVCREMETLLDRQAPATAPSRAATQASETARSVARAG